MLQQNLFVSIVLTGFCFYLIINPAAAQSAYLATCDVDQEIAVPDLDAADNAALEFAQSLTSGNSAKSYAAMSETSKLRNTYDEMVQATRFIDQTGPYSQVQVAHTYFIEVKGRNEPLPPMLCGKSLTDPGAVRVAMLPVPKQFHVEVTLQTINNEWTISEWLIPEQGSIKIVSFSFYLSGISGVSAHDFYKLGMSQSSQGNSLNAALFYQTALQMIQRGPTPVWTQNLNKDVSSLILPPEMAGKPPYLWHLGNQNFEIEGISVIGVGGVLGVTIDRHLNTWSNDTAVSGENRNFVVATIMAYPQLGLGFKFIVSRAFRPDNSGGLSTVYEFGKGFDPEPMTPQ